MISAFVLASAVYAATPCESLKSLNLPDTTITASELIPAGPYTPAPAGPPGGPVAGRGPAPAAGAPEGRGARGGAAQADGGRGGRGGAAAAPPLMLPARCRVAATLKPSLDSAIDIEVWMPADTWNGKFE